MEMLNRVRTKDVGKPATNKTKGLLKKRAIEGKREVNCLKKSALSSDKKGDPAGPKKVKTVLGTKRKCEETTECQKEKRLKMEHCQGVLATLMDHSCACPFLSPVNSDASVNGYYFRVIKRPMDLGTIKRKLQLNKYTDVEEFEADVKLVFSNAMLYHPASHWVHKYAMKLSRLFDIIWMLVKAKLAKESIINQNSSCGNTSIKTKSVETAVSKQQECQAPVKPDCSPSKARAEKMLARFADTIKRAETKTLFQGNKTEVVTSQEEKTRLRPKQDEVQLTARTEAAAKAPKAAAAAARMQAGNKLKKQRQQEREAARAALEKMERTIDLDDNLGSMRDLEALMGRPMLAFRDSRMKSPLEHLGLYIKAEYRLGYESYDSYENLEEGEISD